MLGVCVCVVCVRALCVCVRVFVCLFVCVHVCVHVWVCERERGWCGGCGRSLCGERECVLCVCVRVCLCGV